jgi:alkylresorcinol/alkylpyrone synthase
MLSSAHWNEWSGRIVDWARFERLHRSVDLRGCHLALPTDEYREIDPFAKANDKWIERAVELGGDAALSALTRAGLSPTEIDQIFFATVAGATVAGIASPSIDAKLVNRLSMRPDIKRTPIFGLRCVGGAASVARLFRIRSLFSEVVDGRKTINSSSSASKTHMQHIVPLTRLRASRA